MRSAPGGADSNTVTTEPVALDDSTWQQWRLALLRFVHRLTGSPELAEDIAHEALLRYLQSAHTISHPRAWLFRVAANLVRDHGRRAATAGRPIPVDADTVPKPDDEFERNENVARVRAALDHLSDRDRSALLMREAGFRYEEIGHALQVRTESVPTLMMRALQRFRTAFESDE